MTVIEYSDTGRYSPCLQAYQQQEGRKYKLLVDYGNPQDFTHYGTSLPPERDCLTQQVNDWKADIMWGRFCMDESCKTCTGATVNKRYFWVKYPAALTDITPVIPSCEISEIAISPASPKVGEDVTFSATVRNTGGAALTSNFNLFLDGRREGGPTLLGVWAAITIPAGGTRTLTSPPWIAEEGIHAVILKSVATYDPQVVYCERYGEFSVGKVIPEECATSDFARATDAVYVCGGASACLNEHCASTGKKWKLTVETTKPMSAEKYGTTKPPERTCEEQVSDWELRIDRYRRLCEKDGNYYWVTYPATLREVKPKVSAALLAIAPIGLIGLALMRGKK